jgi:glutaredoxin
MAQKTKIIIIAASLLLLTGCDKVGDTYVGFAKCLKDKGAVMYGAFWCPHCANQKKAFGEEGFAQVNYVECDGRDPKGKPALCEEKKVASYPTWIFADGSRLTGEQSLKELGIRTSCPVPTEK